MSLPIPKILLDDVERRFLDKVIETTTLTGGDISVVNLLTLGDGRKVVVKWSYDAPVGFFRAEVDGLKLLSGQGVISCPEVFDFVDGPTTGPSYILLEYLAPVAPSAISEESFGKSLAKLHSVTSDWFGLRVDNFIGRMPQLNKPTSSWCRFFIDQRLKPQIELGSSSGWFTPQFEKLFRSKLSQIEELLSQDSSAPSLIHGDLWSGNVIWRADGGAVIDPAVYFGSSEAELAFTALFGGFSASFYRGYYAIRPMQEGYQDRKPVLNLYHLMNHANLFGGSYVQSVWKILHGIRI